MIERNLPGKGITADWLKEMLVLKQYFYRPHHFAACALRDRSFKASMQSLIRQFLRDLLHSKKQQGNFWRVTGDFPACLQAVHLRHSKVKHDHVWIQLSGFADGILPVLGVPTNAPTIVALDQTAQQ